MKQIKVLYAIFFIIILLNGCAPGIKYVKDPNIPFEKNTFSVLPPQGDGWAYREASSGKKEFLSFAKYPPGKTHSTIMSIVSQPFYNTFETREDFLKFYKIGVKAGTDPDRFEYIKYDLELDNKFGDYCLKYHVKTKDFKASNRGKNEYLVMEDIGYLINHPYFKNIVIEVTYSERGKPDELSKDIEEKAQKFLDGFKLKKESDSL